MVCSIKRFEVINVLCIVPVYNFINCLRIVHKKKYLKFVKRLFYTINIKEVNPYIKDTFVYTINSFIVRKVTTLFISSDKTEFQEHFHIA